MKVRTLFELMSISLLLGITGLLPFFVSHSQAQVDPPEQLAVGLTEPNHVPGPRQTATPSLLVTPTASPLSRPGTNPSPDSGVTLYRALVLVLHPLKRQIRVWVSRQFSFLNQSNRSRF
jgi:hypothetical protein